MARMREANAFLGLGPAPLVCRGAGGACSSESLAFPGGRQDLAPVQGCFSPLYCQQPSSHTPDPSKEIRVLPAPYWNQRGWGGGGEEKGEGEREGEREESCFWAG